jgi:hypothetical protein
VERLVEQLVEQLTPIGQCRWQWAGAEAGYGEPLYATSPYHAERPCDQPCGVTPENHSKHATAKMRQVLVRSFGGYAWINVAESAIIRYPIVTAIRDSLGN